MILKPLTTAVGALTFLITSASCSRSDTLYDSLTQSIQSVEAQAYVYLAAGRYATENGRSRIIWNIPQDTRSAIRFRYALGTVQDGLIDFQRTGTSFLIISGGLCSKVTVRKVSVLPGGAIDEADSDYTLDRPSTVCAQPRSQLTLALEDVVSLQIDPAKTFAGKVFTASDEFHLCPSEECDEPINDMPRAQPVTRFTAFSTDRNNPHSAFKAELRPGASLLLPNQAGFVKLSSGSGVQILNADYRVAQKSGSALMQKLQVTADDGALNFGSAILSLTAGSVLTFEDVSIAQEKDVTTITRGTLTGTLGGNSFMTLASQGSHKSIISLAQASVTLAGLNMEFRGTKATISGASGDLKFVANSADLYFSDNLHLLFSTTPLGIAFSCDRADTSCRPFSWSNDGSSTVIGRILPVATSLKGGYIVFPGQNKLQIDRGEIQTSDLHVNSRDVVTPVTGSLSKLDLQFHAQSWQIDKTPSIVAATLRLTSQDMSIGAGDSYPVGQVRVEGQISEFTAGGIGRVLASGDTQFTVDASRQPKDDLKIDNGNIKGAMKFRGEDLQTGGNATFSLDQILYYRGVGAAKFSFHVEDAFTHIVTPSNHAELGFSGGTTVVDVHERDIKLKLNKRVGFSDADVKVNNGIWSVADENALPVEVAATVDTGELVNIDVQVGGGNLRPGSYNTICSPHVNINRGNYVLQAKADQKLSNAARRFSVHDVSMQPPFDADVDDRGCSKVAEGICGVIGGLATGGIGAIALAIACGNEVGKYKTEMNDKIKNTAADKLRDLNPDSPDRLNAKGRA